jgi:hypothetical protein
MLYPLNTQQYTHYSNFVALLYIAEPEFVNFYWAQEPIPPAFVA